MKFKENLGFGAVICHSINQEDELHRCPKIFKSQVVDSNSQEVPMISKLSNKRNSVTPKNLLSPPINTASAEDQFVYFSELLRNDVKQKAAVASSDTI